MNNMKKKLFEGLKVADFGWVAEGPMIAKYLSDYGAEVVRLEGRKRPEPMRARGPHKDGVIGLDRSASSNQWNTSKLSLAINLSKPGGVEIAKKIVAWADIVIENFSGGAMAEMGLGYDELKKIKRDIIMLSTCMMGQTGPYASSPGTGSLLPALSGMVHIHGWPERMPIQPGAYTDWVAIHYNVTALLAALDYRRRTGDGQYIDISQYEANVHFLAPLVLDYSVNKRIGGRIGNHCDYAAPHNAYRCLGEEKWCTIAVFNDEEWGNLCRVIGNPIWTKDNKFSSLLTRKENEDELDKLIEEWTIKHTAEEVMKLMQASGVTAGILESGEDLMEYDPQIKHRQFFYELNHPEIGKYRASRAGCFIFSKDSCELKSAPLLGEHNEHILKDILGLRDEEIAQFVIDGVIE
jgi:benzylsuccinate CoA-transferase BbsF subunit